MQQGGFAAPGLANNQHQHVCPLNQMIQQLQTLLEGFKRVIKPCIRFRCKRIPFKAESRLIFLILICLKHGFTQRGIQAFQRLPLGKRLESVPVWVSCSVSRVIWIQVNYAMYLQKVKK